MCMCIGILFHLPCQLIFGRRQKVTCTILLHAHKSNINCNQVSKTLFKNVTATRRLVLVTFAHNSI